MKRPKKNASEVGATEFKARCLELIRAVHDRRLNALIITKRGKPVARVLPPAEEARAFYGCLRGQAKIHGDLTAPVDADWDALAD